MNKEKLIVNMMFVLGFFLVCSFVGFAQQPSSKKIKEQQKTSLNLTAEGNEKLADNNFKKAETRYRRAISKDEQNTAARYNLGNAYYKDGSLFEAFTRFKEAGEMNKTKGGKHKSYHNMGNVFMKNKEYKKAVDTYKQALRNNPMDDETRYNLALAKKMLEKEPQDNEDKDKENKKDKNDKQDEKEDQDKKDEQKEKDKQGEEENKEQNEQGDEENEDKNEPKQEGGDEQKEEQGKEDQPQQPNENERKKGQLSPQQIKQLLEAMNNEDKKVQEKLNQMKIRPSSKRNEKDW